MDNTRRERLEQVAMRAEALAHELGNLTFLFKDAHSFEQVMFSAACKASQSAASILNALARKD